MTDYERARRDECIKLRRLRQTDKDLIESLKRLASQRLVRIEELLHQLELAKGEASVRKDAYAQLCQGLGKAKT
jgi:hypothetical protein